MEDGQLSRLACDRCYRRKARCDKVLPSCSSCLRSGASCCYNARSALVRRDDFEAVERRLRQMEAKNQALSKQLRDARSAQPPSSPRSPAEQPTNGAPEARAASSTAHDDGQESDARNQNEVAKQVFSLSLNAGAQKQYLGSASGAILANLLGLRNSPAHTGEDIDDEPLFRRFTAAGGGQRHGTPEPVKEMILPEQLARGLLGAYLSHDHICYPYLLPKNLVNSVMAMYSEHGYYESHHVEAFTMDMIYAIATAQVHKFSWQVMPDAETHYERAISKFGRVLEIGGLVALQSIMLLCQYRMLSVSYGTSASLWHLLGMAARLGLELGLHREDVYSIPAGLSPSALEDVKVGLELKRRCFWSLFGMDRVVSNTLGRPMAINLEDIDTEYPSLEETSDPISNASPSVDDILQYPQWPRNTAIFVHITWHRVITGKILASLHNMPKSKIPNLETCMDIRQKLADELDQWKAGVSSLPLPNTSRLRSQENTSTFKSPEWYSLLYHNSMLMIYRPTHTSQDISQTTKVLEHIYHSSQQSIQSYSSLHRARRINYTWITLHAVFIVGLSYVHALCTHFQNKRRHFHCLANGLPTTPEGQLPTDPPLTRIVSDTRACSTVLVALSERWNTARDCHEVFGRLSEALLADASDFYINSAHRLHMREQNMAQDSEILNEPIDYDRLGHQISLPPATDFDVSYQDCFEQLHELFGNHYGDNTLLRPPFDWNFDV